MDVSNLAPFSYCVLLCGISFGAWICRWWGYKISYFDLYVYKPSSKVCMVFDNKWDFTTSFFALLPKD